MSYEVWSRLDLNERFDFLRTHRASLDLDAAWVPSTMTYSFLLDDDGRASFDKFPSVGLFAFVPFDPLQQAFVRFQFTYLESFLPIDFEEVAGNAGELGFGKYDMPSDGGYAGATGGKGRVFVDSAPDVNFASGDHSKLGGRVFDTITHEIGHALGLAHPVPYNAGETHQNPMPAELDSGLLTAMTYRSWYYGEFEEGGRVWGFRPLDIAAFDLIYGLKENLEDSTFVLNNITDAAPSKDGATWHFSVAYPFLLVDTGGFDTVDLSQLPAGTTTNPLRFSFDLGLESQPGVAGWIAGPETWEILEAPHLAPQLEIYPGTVIEMLLGGSGAEVVMGNARAQQMQGNGGDDTFDGAGGLDTAIFQLPRSGATVTASGNQLIVIADGTDTLWNVERLQFSDGTLAFDLNGNAGQAYRLYQAAFERTPDADGLSYWIGQMDNGNTTLGDIADSFLHSPEFVSTYGTEDTVSNSEFVELLYLHTLDRGSDGDGYAYWVDKIDSGATNRRDLLAFFSESNENKAQVADAISDGIWLLA